MDGEDENPEQPLAPEIETQLDSDIKAAVESEVEAKPEDEAKPEVKPEAKPQPKPDWKDQRIAKLTAKLKEAQQAKPAAPAAPLDPTEDFNRRVREAAQAQVAQELFSKSLVDETARGTAQFGDEFMTRATALRGLVNVDDPAEVNAYNQFLQAGLETGKLANIVHELGGDLDEATRILGLSPIKMGIELAKLSLREGEPEAISNLPKPIKPLAGGRGDRNPIDPTDARQADSLSTAEWMRRREAQVAASSRR